MYFRTPKKTFIKVLMTKETVGGKVCHGTNLKPPRFFDNKDHNSVLIVWKLHQDSFYDIHMKTHFWASLSCLEIDRILRLPVSPQPFLISSEMPLIPSQPIFRAKSPRSSCWCCWSLIQLLPNEKNAIKKSMHGSCSYTASRPEPNRTPALRRPAL